MDQRRLALGLKNDAALARFIGVPRVYIKRLREKKRASIPMLNLMAEILSMPHATPYDKEREWAERGRWLLLYAPDMMDRFLGLMDTVISYTSERIKPKPRDKSTESPKPPRGKPR